MNRNLDGVYFRVKRGGRYESICFTDLTEQERESIMKGKNNEWLASMVNILADTIQNIGEQLDLVME